MYALLHSPCISCRRIFAYNPHHVPSFPVKGVREPICPECFDAINAERKKRGMAPFSRHPDAYEPVHESEL